MGDQQNWDWEVGERLVTDLDEWKQTYANVYDEVVSPDGEKIGAIVKDEEGNLTCCVNGSPWEQTYEKVYSVRFSPDNRLVAITMADDEWTALVDGVAWEQTFEYVWNLKFSADAGTIAAQVKGDEGYGICLDGKTWEAGFLQIRDYVLSPDGTRVAGSAQVKELAEGDIFEFLTGVWTVAVDGETWDRNFVNVWGLAFSRDGRQVAAEVRLGNTVYTIAVDAHTAVFGSLVSTRKTAASWPRSRQRRAGSWHATGKTSGDEPSISFGGLSSARTGAGSLRWSRPSSGNGRWR